MDRIVYALILTRARLVLLLVFFLQIDTRVMVFD